MCMHSPCRRNCRPAGLARGRSARTFVVVKQNHWTLEVCDFCHNSVKPKFDGVFIDTFSPVHEPLNKTSRKPMPGPVSAVQLDND